MEHVVFFAAPDGSPTFRRVPSLEEAVRLVEHLRNDEDVSNVSVHVLTEVPLAFRAYYRVEVAAEAAAPAQQPVPELVPVLQPASAAAEPDAPPAVEPAHAAPALALVEDEPADEPVLATSNGHAPSSPTSLGFFA